MAVKKMSPKAAKKAAQKAAGVKAGKTRQQTGGQYATLLKAAGMSGDSGK